MNRSRRINFDWQIGLIALSALAGLLIAYNRQAAALQFAIVASAIAVYLVFANLPDRVSIRGQMRPILAALVAALPALIAGVFLITNNWTRWIGKIPALNSLLLLVANWLPGVTNPLNPNVIGGALAALLPLQVFALHRTRRAIRLPLIALTVIALVLSQTRGAWLALLLVLGMWALWKTMTRWPIDKRRARYWWLLAVAGGSVALMAVLTFTSLGESLLSLGGERLAIWHNSIDLVRDYPITGLGLAGFEMVYSTYILLLHVGHTIHAHNLWLDMWLNQGIIGVFALAGMVLNAVWPRPASAWRMPALLALGVVLLYGLIDDPYYGVALLVVFAPLGLLIRPGLVAPTDFAANFSGFQPAYALWIAAAAFFVLGLFTPMGRAALEANLGAVAQTTAELSKYSWPEVPIQDALRRLNAVDLNSAIAHYLAALEIDPTNATANRRLGQIELAREQFTKACSHLAAAYKALPLQRATRQLLGECAAIAGQEVEAVSLWKTIDTKQNQLDIRKWWYGEYLQDYGRAARLQAAMDILARE